jgi:predicted nuclease of predicted toxin-antitoxin system
MTALKLLIDACVAQAVVDALRGDGHDVASVRERGPDPGDPAILAIAHAEGRVVVTIDQDFGTLVFRDGHVRVGVLRLRAAKAATLVARARDLLAAHGDALGAGAFVTDDGDTARVTPRS